MNLGLNHNLLNRRDSMKHGNLASRMKNYEEVSKQFLMRRTPVIIRVDGKAFHNFTKGMKKPFDERLMRTMQFTTESLLKEVEGCSFGYTQSDEISLLLTDYKTLETQPWFDNNIQKIISVVASISTAYFNYKLDDYIDLYRHRRGYDEQHFGIALFDARAFNIPKEEVVNYFVWRQQDATRNSIQMVAQSLYSHKQLHGKSCNDLQEMIFQKGINWNDLEASQKRGTAVYKRKVLHKAKGEPWQTTEPKEDIFRHEIFIDNDTPIFTTDRNYINKHVNIESV